MADRARRLPPFLPLAVLSIHEFIDPYPCTVSSNADDKEKDGEVHHRLILAAVCAAFSVAIESAVQMRTLEDAMSVTYLNTWKRERGGLDRCAPRFGHHDSFERVGVTANRIVRRLKS